MFRTHANRSHKGTSVRTAALVLAVALSLAVGLGVAAPASAAASPDGDTGRQGWAAPAQWLSDLLARWLGLGELVGSASGQSGSGSDHGPGMDPDGLGSEGDDGPGMDPDGLDSESDDGPHMDPNG